MEDLWTPTNGGPTCRLVAADDHKAALAEVARLVPGWTAPPEPLWELRRPELRHARDATLLVFFTLTADLEPVRWRLVSSPRGVLVVGDPSVGDLLRETVDHLGGGDPETMFAAVVLALSKATLATLDQVADTQGPEESMGISRGDLRRRMRHQRAQLFLLQELFTTQSRELEELQDDDRQRAAAHAVRRARQSFAQASGTASRLYALAGDVLTDESALVNERLTLVSTIFLPLTVTTGFFGMNFGWMVDQVGSATAFVVLGILVPALVSAVTIAVVRQWGAGRS